MNSLLNKTFFLIIFLSSQFIKSYEFNIRQVGDTFDDPWSLAFIDEDKFLLSEMPGNLKVISLDTGELIYSVKGVPQVLYDGQGGLSDVVLDPKFSENKKIYFSYSAEDTEEGQLVDDLFSPSNTLFVASAFLVGDTLKDLKIIFKAKAYRTAPAHYGGKIAFLSDGTLIITSGDGYNNKEDAQFLDNHFGKIIRINPDGSVPSDNPFVDQDNALPEIYSYGHRNMQGLVISNDVIYENEHGPKGGDEFNIVEPGKNYGWPAICYCVDYSGAQITPFTEMEGMEQPLTYWRPSIAPSGMMLYSGKKFKEWKDSFFISALSGKILSRLTLNNGKVEEEILLKDFNERLRNVYETPSGNILLLTDGPGGKIFELSP